MAALGDIDTKSLVGKFLERRVVAVRNDEGVDTTQEIEALLESIALSFLLYPQVALSMIQRGRNILLQLLTTDINLVDFLSAAIADLRNPDQPVTDTSDVLEAQTALVELDRVGKVQKGLRAFERYNAAINRFLNQQLASTLKRRRRREFERTGAEARQDLFQAVTVFNSTHAVVASRLKILAASVTSFRAVDLTRLVAARTLTRVRSSLRQVQKGLQQKQISKTVVALELLSGSAALNAISRTTDVYDPTVRTGSLPSDLSITLSAEPVAATVLGTAGSQNLGAVATPWIFKVKIDGGSEQDIEVPGPGASKRSVVKSRPVSATGLIPAGSKLFVRVDGTELAIALTAGPAVPFATLVADINTGMGVSGSCVALASGVLRFLIRGAAGVNSVVVLGAGTPTVISGVVTPAAASAHVVLGFDAFQQGSDPNIIQPTDLADLLTAYLPAASVVGEITDTGLAVRISSLRTDLLSSLSFPASGVAAQFGFTGDFQSEPSYVFFTEEWEEVSPQDLGVFVGSRVSAAEEVGAGNRTLNAPVDRIEGNFLFFAEGVSLPRGSGLDVTVIAPLVSTTQSFLSSLALYTNSFDTDGLRLQQVLAPLFSSPTPAQINDTTKVLKSIRQELIKLQSVLAVASVRSDRSQFDNVAMDILSALEGRNLDRGKDLLFQGDFSGFFALSQKNASRGSRFLSAMEDVGRNDLATTTIESEQARIPLSHGTNPSSETLPDTDMTG